MPDTILVFSHLRWDFVYQRPQHLLRRMASKRRVIFFEEPVYQEDCQPFLQLSHPEPGVMVCRPHTSFASPGYQDQQIPCLEALLKELLYEQRLLNYMAWFYTPMALPLLRDLDPRLIVYDCMDELSGFMKAPEQLVQREKSLLKVADLVFTGGPSLYEAKKHLHPEVYCFPSSVDTKHFSRARDPRIDHRCQRDIPRPRLGFYGVLDERLDLTIIRGLAKAHPDWQIVLVGPVAKISPGLLPRLPNIHYFDKQEYADLPSFLAGWDVCLMPFALNEATRFISPTKTLEYMAAEKPIVSTPITDVVRPYGDIVCIADGVRNFIRGCEKALALLPDEQEGMIEKMRRVLASTSWDATAEAMDRLICKACRRKLN